MTAISAYDRTLVPPENAQHFSGLKHVMAEID